PDPRLVLCEVTPAAAPILEPLAQLAGPMRVARRAKDLLHRERDERADARREELHGARPQPVHPDLLLVDVEGDRFVLGLFDEMPADELARRWVERLVERRLEEEALCHGGREMLDGAGDGELRGGREDGREVALEVPARSALDAVDADPLPRVRGVELLVHL